jgi:RimJ/RimL family protein N-acetyltransferase
VDFRVEPVSLAGREVRLEPLSQEHAAGLYNRGQNAFDWRYMPRPCFVDLPDCRQWIDEALSEAGQLPFAIVETGQGRAVGSSRYLNIRPAHRGLEIGYTWVGSDWQGTAVNTEAKLLLVGHAFETLGAERVEFKADARNERSRRALKRIGALEEGTRRRHMVVQDGFLRDSVYFSITAAEWPAVKSGLQEKLSDYLVEGENET